MSVPIGASVAILKTFLCGFVIDVAYVFWMRGVHKERYLLAAVASMCVAAPMLLGFSEVLSDWYMAIPYLLGLACGTMAAMRLEKANGENRGTDPR